MRSEAVPPIGGSEGYDRLYTLTLHLDGSGAVGTHESVEQPFDWAASYIDDRHYVDQFCDGPSPPPFTYHEEGADSGHAELVQDVQFVRVGIQGAEAQFDGVTSPMMLLPTEITGNCAAWQETRWIFAAIANGNHGTPGGVGDPENSLPTDGSTIASVLHFTEPGQGGTLEQTVTVHLTRLPDRDHDGVPDGTDQCPDEPSPTANGCPPDGDRDSDGVADAADNCAEVFNPDQIDTDGDGRGNVCDSDLTAHADWTMPDRTFDEDHNGLIDGYLAGSQSAIVPASGKYNVTLDGCGSSGTITSWQWVINGQSYTSGQCQMSIKSVEGDLPSTLTVSGPDGSASVGFTLRVHDQLIVGLGDSYGSGEGAPGGTTFSQRWAQQPCHRSVRSGQAVAALRLEQADPRSSVTFIHLACSGATGPKGIYGAYPDPPGAPRPGETKAQEPQIVTARRLAHGQPIDAVLLSIGGNDIGFADVITTCARFGRCPTEHRRFRGAQLGPFDVQGTVTHAARSLHEESQAKLRRLRSRYDQVAACLSSGASGACPVPRLGVNPARVFVTEYPNLATDQSGGYCDGLLRPPFDSGIADEELQWATEVLQQGVGGQQFTLDVNFGSDPVLDLTQDGLDVQINELGRLGWSPVSDIYRPFVGHGICADVAWVNGLDDSFRHQHDQYGAFHPNGLGYQAYADAIVPAVESPLGLPVPGP